MPRCENGTLDGRRRGWPRPAARIGPLLVLLFVVLTGLDAAAQQADDAAAQRPPELEAYDAIAESYAGAGALDATQRGIGRARAGLRRLAERAPLLGRTIRDTLAAASPTGEPAYFLGLIAFLVFLIGIGRAMNALFGVYVARPIFMRMQRAPPQGLADKAPVLVARVGLTVVGLLLTLGTAVAVGGGFYPEDNDAAVQTAIVAFGAYATFRLVDTVWRMLCAPYLSEYRLPRLSDREALRLYRWLAAATFVAVASIASSLWFDALGLPRDAMALLRTVLFLAQSAVIGGGAWINRHAITAMFLGGAAGREASWPALAAATIWGPALAAFLLGGGFTLARRSVLALDLGPPPVGVLFVVLLVGLTVYCALLYAIDRLARRHALRRRNLYGDEASEPPDFGAQTGEDDGFAQDAAQPPARPAGRRVMRSFEDLAKRVASLFAFGAALWTLIVMLGGRALLQEGAPLGVAQGLIDILLVGYVLFHAARIWIDRRIVEEGADVAVMAEPGDEGGAAAASSRQATLLPLVRNAVLILIGVSVAILMAMEAGLNVAPLLGGAGVIGLAIGFGSQTLIRDILSGAFYLFDDAFRKGEYIDIGDVKGTVEKISLRSFQLRHHLGALHTVPFGEIRHLTNFSRDWVMMKLPLRLTYDTDPEKVRKLIKKLGEKLLEHPTEGAKFLQPLKSQGVYMMEDSAMIIRVKFMTKPGDQWTTRKLVYSEIRDLFEREGIHFAHKEVTVRMPDFRDRSATALSEAEAEAVGAAARRAVDDDVAVKPRAVGDAR